MTKINDQLVLIPGFRKSGTTSLYDVLADNLQFNTTHIKEPQLLINEYFRRKKTHYTSLFSGKNTKYLDASTYYIWNQDAFKFGINNFDQMKVIIMIRNPVDRFYSAVYHNKTKIPIAELRSINDIIKCYLNGQENYEYLASTIKNSDVDFYRRNKLADLPFSHDAFLNNYLYINEGFYSKKIQMLDEIGAEYKVITFEGFVNDFTNTLQDVLQFLDIKSDVNKFQIKKSNVTQGKSRLIHHAKSKLPYISSLLPRSFKKAITNKMSNNLSFDKLECKDELNFIYKDEIAFWKNNLSAASKCW